MYEQLGWRVIELIGSHGSNHCDVIGARCDVGEKLRDPLATLPVLGKRKHRREHLGNTFDEREPFAFEVFLGARLTVVLVELWLEVEKFQLRWRARHVKINYMLRLCWQRWDFGRQRTGATGFCCRKGCGTVHGSQRHGSDANPRPAEKMPPSLLLDIKEWGHDLALSR